MPVLTTQVYPKRGRITVPDRNTGREFMFQPTDHAISKAVNYGSSVIAGASHPQYQYGSGGENVVSFELYLDGDRGRLGRGIAQNSFGDNPLDISDEIRFYQSLLYSTRYGGLDVNQQSLTQSLAQVFPATVLLTIDTLINGMRCIVKKADPKITFSIPDPTRGNIAMPVRALVSMQLAEIVDTSRVADDYWPSGFLGGQIQ